MGLCAAKPNNPGSSPEEEKRNQQIEKQNLNDHEKDARIQKLLLLGAGESGKSTLFKQIIDLYGKGFTEDEIQQYVAVVHTNTIQSMQTLVQQAEKLAQEGHKDCALGSDLKADQDSVLGCKSNGQLDADMAASIKRLWAHPAIKATYEKRSSFQMPVSAAYFFDKVEQVAQAGWLPQKQDILQTRVRTTGIMETSIAYQGFQLKLIDVGGQRSERKKWINCFEGVDAVLFVAAISEYDQKLFEDENVNRMHESMNIFEEVSNLHVFKDSTFVLFLNKSDLFQEKIAKSSIKNCFPNYSGPDEFEPAWNYIADQYLARKKERPDSVYVQVTCATDDSNVTFVFNTVRDIVIKKALKGAGLDMDF